MTVDSTCYCYYEFAMPGVPTGAQQASITGVTRSLEQNAFFAFPPRGRGAGGVQNGCHLQYALATQAWLQP